MGIWDLVRGSLARADAAGAQCVQSVACGVGVCVDILEERLRRVHPQIRLHDLCASCCVQSEGYSCVGGIILSLERCEALR